MQFYPIIIIFIREYKKYYTHFFPIFVYNIYCLFSLFTLDVKFFFNHLDICEICLCMKDEQNVYLKPNRNGLFPNVRENA